MSIFRSPHNPVIEPKDITPTRDDFEVIGVFNAAVTRFENEVILLLRIAQKPVTNNQNTVLAPIYDVAKDEIILKEFSKNDPAIDFSDPRLIITPAGTYLTSISHLAIARSKDGIDFEIDPAPAITAANDYETFGIEDPRISFIDNTYYITYVAASPLGVTTRLASTNDFKKFQRHGVIFCPDNKDVVLLPQSINGKYYALHRPASALFGKHDIWLAESENLLNWGNHRRLMAPRPDCWDELKIGAGAPPFKNEAGWIEIYHGADKNNRYCLGAVLLDSHHPWKIIARTEQPIFQPQTDYECEGFFGNVIFSCGLLAEKGQLKIYYGAADTSIAYAQIPLEDILTNLKQSQTPH